MKTQLQLSVILTTWVVLLMTFCLSCSKPEEQEVPVEEEEGEEITPEGADALMKSMVFVNSTNIMGNRPAVVNTSLVKTNTRDTIYTMPGIKTPIRISHPVSASIKGIFIAVQQATFYYDVPIEREEESDTVSVIILDIDPTDLEVPYTIPVKIIPYDENKSPVDEIDRVISVEQPSGNGCDILVTKPSTLSDTSGIWTPEWFWFATMVFKPNGEITFLNAPGNTFITQTNYEGCCDASRPGGKCHPLSTTLNATVSARIAYTIESETFTFFTDGTFARQTHERKQNFNPETTDWCSGAAGYTLDDVVVTYFGNHDYVPGKSNISYGTTYASCDLCGYGSRGGNISTSCHTLVITRQSESSKEVRMYVRNPVSEWYE